MMSNNRKKQKSSSIEIYKRMLLSRNTEEQMKAVNSLYVMLKYNESDFQRYVNLIDWLLMNDICVFLCEASATLQIHLLRLILECFKKFASVPSFYKKSHSPQVVTSIVRTIQFLVKENGSENVINELLSFISEVFVMSKQYHSPPIISCESVYNIIQIFELLSVILEKISYETATKISIAVLLHKAIERIPKNTKITYKSLLFAKDIIERCLKSLNQRLVVGKYKCKVERKLNIVFAMICRLCMDSLYLCNNSCVVFMKKIDNKEDEPIKSSILECVYNILYEITSQMKEFDLSVLESNYDIFLELLNEVLNQQSLPREKILAFVQHLCSHGFLAFLAQLAPISTKTKKICLVNLAEIIYVLSLDTFNVEAYGNKEKFKSFIFEGFMDIGINSKLWPKTLQDTFASSASINALITYIYFNCLYSQRPENTVSPLLPYLVEFILQLPKRGICPKPILKCLWLIFSIACVSNPDFTSIRGGILCFQRSISVMSNLLLHKIKDVYTHSPFIIQWTFSSHRISHIIQNQVITLWLKKESTISEDLANIPALWSSLLEVIVLGEGNVDVNLVKEILKECLLEYTNDKDYIRQEIWGALPDILKSLSVGQSTNVQAALSLIEICFLCPPNLPDLSTIQTTSSLLPVLVLAGKKYSVDVGNHFVKAAYMVLLNALKHEDKCVLSQFINGRILLQSIYDATLSEDITLSKVAFELLTTIMYYKSHYDIKSPNCIKMDPSHLIVMLRDEKDPDKCMSLLTLIHQTFKLGKSDPDTFVIFATSPPIDVFVNVHKAIFFRLQMNCCKDLKHESLTSWCGLNSLLEFAYTRSDIPQLMKELASLPWTHKLIHFYLYQNQAAKCHRKFLKFVFNWLTCQKALPGNDVKLSLNKDDPFAECNILHTTITRVICHFNDDDLQTTLPKEKKEAVNAVLNLISENFI